MAWRTSLAVLIASLAVAAPALATKPDLCAAYAGGIVENVNKMFPPERRAVDLANAVTLYRDDGNRQLQCHVTLIFANRMTVGGIYSERPEKVGPGVITSFDRDAVAPANQSEPSSATAANQRLSQEAGAPPRSVCANHAVGTDIMAAIDQIFMARGRPKQMVDLDDVTTIYEDLHKGILVCHMTLITADPNMHVSGTFSMRPANYGGESVYRFEPDTAPSKPPVVALPPPAPSAVAPPLAENLCAYPNIAHGILAGLNRNLVNNGEASHRITGIKNIITLYSDKDGYFVCHMTMDMNDNRSISGTFSLSASPNGGRPIGHFEPDNVAKPAAQSPAVIAPSQLPRRRT
jgi:hypothetical protein